MRWGDSSHIRNLYFRLTNLSWFKAGTCDSVQFRVYIAFVAGTWPFTLLKTNPGTQHSLACRQQLAFLAAGIAFECRLDPSAQLVVIDLHFAVIRHPPNNVVVLLVQCHCALHDFSAGADNEVIRASRIADLRSHSRILGHCDDL